MAVFRFIQRTRYVQYFSATHLSCQSKTYQSFPGELRVWTVWTWAFLQSSRIRSRTRCFRSLMCTGIASGVSLWWSDGGCQSPSVSKKRRWRTEVFMFLLLHTAGLCDLKGCIYVFLFMIYGMLSTKPIGKFPKKQWCDVDEVTQRIVVRSREGWSNGGKDVCEMFTASIKWSQYPTNLWIILSLDIPHTKCCQNVAVDVYIRFQGRALKPLTPQAMIRLQGRRQDQWMCSSSTTTSAISQITS